MRFCSLCACPKLIYSIPNGELVFCIPSELKRLKLN
jgi:hypothetical protein